MKKEVKVIDIVVAIAGVIGIFNIFGYSQVTEMVMTFEIISYVNMNQQFVVFCFNI